MRELDRPPGGRARVRWGRALLVVAAAVGLLALLAPGAQAPDAAVVNALVHG